MIFHSLILSIWACFLLSSILQHGSVLINNFLKFIWCNIIMFNVLNFSLLFFLQEAFFYDFWSVCFMYLIFSTPRQAPVLPLQRNDGPSFHPLGQNEVQRAVDHPLEQGIPTIITWSFGGNNVAVEGSWDNWRTRWVCTFHPYLHMCLFSLIGNHLSWFYFLKIYSVFCLQENTPKIRQGSFYSFGAAVRHIPLQIYCGWRSEIYPGSPKWNGWHRPCL